MLYFKYIRSLCYSFAFLYVLAMSMPAQSAPIDLNELVEKRKLGQGLLIFEDKQASLNIEQVHIMAEGGQFTPWPKNILHFGYSQSVYWVRIELANDFVYDKHFFLEQEFSSLDHLELFQLTSEGDFDHQINGDRVPFNERSFNYHNHIFSFLSTAGEHQVIYLKIWGNGALKAPLFLYSAEAFFDKVNVEMGLFGLFFGVLVVMAAYNVFLFIIIRDKVYLYYVVYVVLAIITASSWDGLAAEYLWPNSPWWADRVVLVSIGLVNFATHLFAQALLNTKKHLPRIHLLLQAVQLLSLIQVVLALGANYTLAGQFSLLLTLLSSVAGIFAGIVSTLYGLRSARLYLTAWSLYFSGVIILALTSLGLLPYHWFTQYIMHLGWVLETTLFSVALAERVNHQKEKRQQAERLQFIAEAEVKTKGRLLADISHEIRTPLHGIMGSAQLLQSTSQNLQQQRYCEQIIKSSDLLSELVDNTLDYVRFEQVGVTRKDEGFAIADLLDEVQLLMLPLTQQNNLAFSVLVDEAVPNNLHGDRRLIRQVLINLVGNAIKYTAQGSITVNVEVISLAGEQIEVQFNVRDTGQGVSQELADNLFQPFFRNEPGGEPGTGLGLSISKSIVEALGGNIGLDSELSQGSTFWIKLPLQLAHNPLVNSSQKPLVKEEQRLTNLRILVVDDVELNRNIAMELLSQDQHQVVLAASAEQAINELESQTFDLILMDIFLPGIDGIQLTKMIRQQEKIPENTPIIAVTASAYPTNIFEYLEAGMQNVIAKPVKLATLRRVLYQTLISSDEPVAGNTELCYQAEHPNDLPLLDTELLGVMRQSITQLKLSEFIMMGEKGSLEVLDAIFRAVAAQDSVLLKKMAHKLSGTAHQLGLSRLAVWARQLENEGVALLSHPNGITQEELQVIFDNSFSMLKANVGPITSIG